MRRLLLFLLLLLVNTAQAQPVLTWVMVDGPPFHERPQAQRVEDLGQGPQDQRLRLLIEALPQFRHEVRAMSLAKLWRDMRQGRPLCYADAFKTAERRNWAHFVELAPSPRLVVAARRGRLPQGAELSLRELLEQGRLRGAFELERSYGEGIDRLLLDHRQTRLPLPADGRLLRMLDQGRMDYVLEYPAALQVSAPRHQPVDLRLVLEDRDPAPTQLACTRSMGLELMRSVDVAVRRLATNEAWIAHQLLAYPADMRDLLRPQLERYGRERAAQGERIY